MSIQLPEQDLSTAVQGTKGSIPLSIPNRPTTIVNKRPSVSFFNESGCGLSLNFRGSNRQIILPAGAWTKPLEILDQDSAIDYTVLYVLPNSPVAFLYTVLYYPDEKPLETAALGNSPIGISGNVSTSQVNSLINDGNAAPTQIIESTPSGQGNSSFNLNNDGSGFWQTLSAGILRKIINVVRGDSGTTKAQIIIGDSGDLTITTYYGQLAASVTIGAGQISPGNFTAGQFTFNTGNAGVSGLPFQIVSTTTTPGGHGDCLKIINGIDASYSDIFGIGDATQSPFGAGWYAYDVKNNGLIFSQGTKNGINFTGQILQNGGNKVGQMIGSGATAGNTTWIGPTDPGASAGEGDIWIPK